MTKTTPPSFQLGTITCSGWDHATSQFYAAISTSGHRPVVILSEAGANEHGDLVLVLDTLANGLLQHIPALARGHPHQIDWYVTDWLCVLDHADGQDPSIAAHLERIGLSLASARSLRKLDFRIVGSEEGRSGYRVAGALLSGTEERPEDLLAALEATYERTGGAIRWT